MIKMLQKELKVANVIVEQKDSLICNHKGNIQSLKVQLRTPRHHMEFLNKAGKLEEFIDAKVSGQEAAAKWLLL
jgi:hypothetical protein